MHQIDWPGPNMVWQSWFGSCGRSTTTKTMDHEHLLVTCSPPTMFFVLIAGAYPSCLQKKEGYTVRPQCTAPLCHTHKYMLCSALSTQCPNIKDMEFKFCIENLSLFIHCYNDDDEDDDENLLFKCPADMKLQALGGQCVSQSLVIIFKQVYQPSTM